MATANTYRNMINIKFADLLLIIFLCQCCLTILYNKVYHNLLEMHLNHILSCETSVIVRKMITWDKNAEVRGKRRHTKSLAQAVDTNSSTLLVMAGFNRHRTSQALASYKISKFTARFLVASFQWEIKTVNKLIDFVG